MKGGGKEGEDWIGTRAEVEATLAPATDSLDHLFGRLSPAAHSQLPLASSTGKRACRTRETASSYVLSPPLSLSRSSKKCDLIVRTAPHTRPSTAHRSTRRSCTPSCQTMTRPSRPKTSTPPASCSPRSLKSQSPIRRTTTTTSRHRITRAAHRRGPSKRQPSRTRHCLL